MTIANDTLRRLALLCDYLGRHRPSPEYGGLIARVKDELRECGLKLE